ncbi:5'-nucleotidase C-terminal domain-containing protein [Marivirga sp. S37H4]|uniref:5'-nucleotidase C-terminal domain-containing protein n=1 Tax=Marivirga aurantiaca TaxID=2802615 RepID=A0A934WV27_9BACT|nr:5'-nucleotidase C-terminal domain-containing protein [Marivirga aurantiaca]MBK6263543.1 5'-nucleotidase C-terminal domain-containing protein [Marivirga aurantiaca]
MKYIFLLLSTISITLLSSCNQPATMNNTAYKTTNDTISITILQTADIHGQLDSHPELFWENGEIKFKQRGGLANIKTLFEQEREKNPHRTVILDGGDLIQGSGYAALSEGAIFPEIVKQMGYDVIIPGNWEVVYGKDIMLKVMKGYETHVIAQNMQHDLDKENLFPPYWIKEIEGIRIGFIGLNDPAVPIRQNPIFSKGVTFSGIDHHLKELIDKVKQEEKVDVLFLITHIGAFKQIDLASNEIAENVDYILGNDTHERIRDLIVGKYAKVAEPGAFGSFVGKLTLHFLDGKRVGDEYELIDVDPATYPANEPLQKMIDEAKKPYKDNLETVIGYTTTPLYRYLTVENPMDNMITDAAKWKTGADISISNGFRFGNPIVPEKGENAPITKANLWDILPINENIKTGKASGRQIKDWLEKEIHNAFSPNANERFGGWMVRFSGMRVEFDVQKEKGERVQSITVNGNPMEESTLYTISACVRPGDPLDNLCRMENLQDVIVKDYTIHDAVIEYLGKHSPISPTIDGRSYSDDLGKYSFSTIPGTNYVFE